MKKIKIMLTAITVVAVVSGALAFKAKKAYLKTIYTSTSSSGCTIRTDGFEIAGNSGPFVWAAPTDNGTCQSVQTRENE